MTKMSTSLQNTFADGLLAQYCCSRCMQELVRPEPTDHILPDLFHLFPWDESLAPRGGSSATWPDNTGRLVSEEKHTCVFSNGAVQDRIVVS